MKKSFLLLLPLLLGAQMFAQTCDYPLETRPFANAFADLATRTVGLDRSIRDFTRSNCLTSNQIAQLAGLYRFDNERYEYAMFAYPLSFDPQNFDIPIATIRDAGMRKRLSDYVYNNPIYPPHNQPVPVPVPVPVPAPAPPPAPIIYVPGYNGPIGCVQPMSQQDFNSALNSIHSKSFESTRLEVAKQITNANCLTSAQVRSILQEFSFESTRLDFAQFAYSHVYDINNYHQVTSAFSFESSTTSLLAYMDTHPPMVVQPPVYQPVYEQPYQPAYDPNYDPNYQHYNPGNNPGYQNNPYYTPAPTPPPVYVPGYNGRIGCNAPMTQQEFDNAQRSVHAKSFENTRFDLVKQILNNNCMTVDQIRRMSKEFTFDNTRLDFAKYAFNHVYDIDNYYQLTDIFDFESNGNALLDYIRGK